VAYLDLKSAISDPRSDESSRMIRSTTQGDENSSILRMRNLSNEQRSRSEDDRISQPKQESRRNEHPEIAGTGLNAYSKQHDAASQDDTTLSTEPINQEGDEEQADQGPETHGCIEQPECRAFGMVEIFLPVGEGLETIHHGSIKTISGVGHDEDDDVHVQSAEIGVLVPLDARECSPCEEEVSLRWFHRFQGFILASPRKFWEETHRECKSTLVPRLEIG